MFCYTPIVSERVVNVECSSPLHSVPFNSNHIKEKKVRKIKMKKELKLKTKKILTPFSYCKKITVIPFDDTYTNPTSDTFIYLICELCDDCYFVQFCRFSPEDDYYNPSIAFFSFETLDEAYLYVYTKIYEINTH